MLKKGARKALLSEKRASGAKGGAQKRTFPKNVVVGRLEELDVVLHAAVGALRLLQPIPQVLEAALVSALCVVFAPMQLVQLCFIPAQLGLQIQHLGLGCPLSGDCSFSSLFHLSFGILNGHLQLACQGAALTALLLQPQLTLVDRLLTFCYDLKEFYVLGTRGL